MQRTLLIVDDITTNREILKKILGSEYRILEAEDGGAALEIMRSSFEEISAVLLDLSMPLVDGFEVLSVMRSDERLRLLPVIVTTGQTEEDYEMRALALGANDYITKPYNSAIIKHRIRNTVNLRETAAAVNRLQRDGLTGLYERTTFFKKAGEMIAARESGYYAMAALNINGFKVINDQYGTDMGDRVLRHLGECFDKYISAINGICCRIAGDGFAAVYPSEHMDSDALNACRAEAAAPPFLERPVSIRAGRYVVTEPEIPVSAMYDRACIAQALVKGRYDISVAQYDESMRQRILREQEIVNEMNSALASGQFEVWLQPQFNHSSGAIIGAEALVRWRHPERGIVSPNDFIPVFERNGFIYKLDQYVWEQTCILLKKWLGEGRTPLPLSVNISRFDLQCEDLAERITGLVKKYDLPPGLLRLEITESAFAGDSDHLIDMVEQLIGHGFTVELDDFGSGYSSLNTLKDVPVDILKLDMRFLAKGRNSEKGGNILESVVRMARWLGMPVIAEGVETIEQAEYLKSIGCHYLQGYLYARPMPVEEFEVYAAAYDREQEMLTLEVVENLNNNSFWDPGSMETLIFNSYVGGACIFEYCDGEVDLLRINKNYIQELSAGRMTAEQAQELKLSEHMDAQNLERLMENIRRAIETETESSCEVRLFGIAGEERDTYIRAAVRAIAKADFRYLLYCSIINTTALREAERKEWEANERIENLQNELLDNLPGGAALYRVSEGKLYAVHLNRRYRQLVGRRLIEPEKASVLDAVHPDDRERVLSEVKTAIAEKRDIYCVLRLRYGEEGEEYRSFQADGRIIDNGDGSYSVYAAFLQLSDDKKTMRELLPQVLSVIMDSTTDLSFAKDKSLRYLCGSRPFIKMAGLSSESELIGKTDYDLFDKPTADKFRSDDERLMASGHSIIDMIESIPSTDGIKHSSSTSKYLLRDASGSIIGLYGVGRDITEYHAAFEQLKLLTENLPGGLASYVLTENGIRNIYFNEGFYSFSGYNREEYARIVAADPWGLIFREDMSPLLEGLQRIRQGSLADAEYRYRCHTKSGGFRWMSMKVMVAEAHDEELIINTVRFDITEQKLAEEQLRMSEEQYRLAMEQSGNIMCRYEVEDMSVNMSAEAAAIFDQPEKLAGVPYSMIRRGTIAPQSVDAYIDFFEGILRGERSGTAEYLCKTVQGWRWLKANQATVFSDDGRPVYAVISLVDNTERHRKEEEHSALLKNERILRLRASTDGLTGVYNKSATEQRIRELLEKSGGEVCGLLIMDIDDLKTINDTLGHPEGDRAIRAVADALEAHFRRTDVIGRVGGDEFIVFLHGAGTTAQLSDMLKALLSRVAGIKIGPEDNYQLSISVGAALTEGEPMDFEELYSRADTALYSAKRSGKKQFAFFSPELAGTAACSQGKPEK